MPCTKRLHACPGRAMRPARVRRRRALRQDRQSTGAEASNSSDHACVGRASAPRNAAAYSATGRPAASAAASAPSAGPCAEQRGPASAGSPRGCRGAAWLQRGREPADAGAECWIDGADAQPRSRRGNSTTRARAAPARAPRAPCRARRVRAAAATRPPCPARARPQTTTPEAAPAARTGLPRRRRPVARRHAGGALSGARRAPAAAPDTSPRAHTLLRPAPMLLRGAGA